MVKHKAFKETLDKGYAVEWNDDHLQDYENKIDLECDFITWRSSEYFDFTKTTSGINPSNVLVDGHVSVYFRTGAGVGNITDARYMLGITAENITSITDLPILTTALWLETIEAIGNVVEFGLINNDTANPFTANQEGAYFRIEDNKLWSVTGDGVGETATNITPTGGINEYDIYRIILTGANCYFYVEDMTAPASVHIGNLPPGDLTIIYSIRNLAGTDSVMFLDAVGLQRKRYTG